MRRRSKAGSEPVRARQRKAAVRKCTNAPKAARHRSSSTAGRETEFARVSRERDEALEQLAATSEVLRVISASPGDLHRVFQAMLENATKLCEANYGTMYLREGDGYRATARNLCTSTRLYSGSALTSTI